MNKANAKCGMRNAEWNAIKTPNSELHTLNSKGFTLIEVLLALAILAAVMTAVYASFSTASRNVESAEAVRDETDLARTLIVRLSDDIANAYYNSTMSGTTIFYGKKEEAGTGNDRRRLDSISMTTLTNWRKPDSKETDLWEVGYHFEETADGKGHALLRREKRELSKDIPLLEGGVDLEITDKVEKLQLRYFNGYKWSDEWDTRKHSSLPQAVEITLSLAEEKRYTTVVDVGNRR
ncbi:MAG TPA: type II secretion system protein GspJ [Nitrospirota bacterium]|nr:type II secretion system protein GspJ [Nitrospirota bacterium]